MSYKRVKKSLHDEIREAAEADLWTFAQLLHPERVYGDVHKEAFRFLQHTSNPNSLLLLPRAHMKSHCIAVWAAWKITIEPETTILYVSATSTLAEAQLYAIKNILTSAKYQAYWPEMIHPDEGKREKWSNGAIAVDHPKRKKEGVRDMTVVAAGLTTNTTGLHADVIIADDVVVPDNAYTEEGRRKVSAAMSQMASILNTGGVVKACGTRYHPADQYSLWKAQTLTEYDDVTGDLLGEAPLWDIMEKVVEVNGVFLWPRAARDDGKLFGFDRTELARISAMYTDRTQFYAQYYNDPNDPESNRVDESKFQYYDQRNIKQLGGDWYFKDRKLNIVAAIDFAYTIGRKSDYTAIVVIGMDYDNNIYILDMDRFQTDKISEYYSHIERLHVKWEFRKLRAEVTAAQSIIVGDLKDRIRDSGLFISIDAHKPNRHTGSKEERIAAVLEPRYDAMKIWHYKGGHTPALEEEVVLARPQHDDLKDCLASAIELITPPKGRSSNTERKERPKFHSRFGGRV